MTKNLQQRTQRAENSSADLLMKSVIHCIFKGASELLDSTKIKLKDQN